jgi:hypothetical protein
MTVIVAETQSLVVLQEGPRGAAGPGVTVRGEWDNATQYTANDGVSWRSSATNVYSSLYIAVSGVVPTVGVEPQDELSAWAEVGLQVADSPLGAVWTVTQVAHGFTRIGTPLHFDAVAQEWVLAAAATEKYCHAVIREVVSVDTLVLQSAGEIIELDPLVSTDGFWTVGQIYCQCLSAGQISPITPASRQHILVITDVSGGGLGTGVLLAWDVANETPPASEGPTPPPSPEVGNLWLRTTDYPGLYVAMPRSGGGTAWAQANG